MLGCLIAAPSAVLAQSFTWDPSQNTTGSDADGNWDLIDHFWATPGSDVAWPNTNTSAAVFGVGGSGTQTVTLTSPITANALTFNAGPNYTIASTTPATNTLTLAGTTPTITVNSGTTPTISAIVAGSAGLTLATDLNPSDNLTLTGANTYTGTTSIGSGTLTIGAGGNTGAAANAMILGTTGPAANTGVSNLGTLILNGNDTVGNFTCNTINSTTVTTTPNFNLLQINGSSVFTINGTTNVGLSVTAGTPTIALKVTGNELDANNTINVGLADTAGRDSTILDMSGLATFKMNATGTGQALNIGTVNQAGATVSLANNSTINTLTVSISNTTSNAGTCVLNLGGGTTLLEANTFNLGVGKGNGTIQYLSTTPTGSVTITGANGTGTASINIGVQTSATAGSNPSQLLLAGHNATVNAGTVIVAQQKGNTGGNAKAIVSFDTGTFNANVLSIGLNTTGTANSANSPNGTFNLGTNASSTGVLTVSGTGAAFTIAQNSNTSGTIATGTFNIHGGTANIFVPITSPNTSTGGTSNATINLAALNAGEGGTLNMGNATTQNPIGGNVPTQMISTFNMPISGNTATITNLGGGGIYAGEWNRSHRKHRRTHSGRWRHVDPRWHNTYTGPTNINSGTLQFGSSTPAVNSTVNINTDNSLTFSPSVGTFQIGGLGGGNAATLADLNSAPVTLQIRGSGGSYGGSLTGGGSLSVAGTNGTTVQTLTGTNSYSGNTTISAGTLQLQGGSLYSGVGSPGTVNVSGGTLAGDGTIASSVVMGSGTIAPDTSGSALHLTSLTGNSGQIKITLNGSTISLINVDGSANLVGGVGGGSFAFAPISPVAGTYTFLNAGLISGSLINSFSLTPQTVSGTTFTPFKSGNSLMVTVVVPNTLLWKGNLPGAIWDVGSSANWTNTVTSSSSVFHNGDTVTFDDSATSFNVNITAPVQPSSVPSTVALFTNSTGHNYVISSSNGNGIGGIGGLTVNSNDGGGSVTLQTANTYTGNTTVQSGTLILSSGGSIASPNINVSTMAY